MNSSTMEEGGQALAGPTSSRARKKTPPLMGRGREGGERLKLLIIVLALPLYGLCL